VQPNIDNLKSLTSITLDHQHLWWLGIECERRASWHACKALCATEMLDEMAMEWSAFVTYKWIHLMVCIREIQNGRGGGLLWNNIHLLFIAFCTFNRNRYSKFIGDTIYEIFGSATVNGQEFTLQEIHESELDVVIEDPENRFNLNTLGFHGFSEGPLCEFCLRMWFILSGQRKPPDAMPENSPQCDIYGELFTNWNKPDALINSLAKAADFHVNRMNPNPGIHHDIPEFETTPFRQIPFELLAYRNVRRKMGLETPWPSHPLLDSPFVKNLPDELPPFDDPLLNDVLAAVRKVLPVI
jgi:hypothetical protein